MNDNAEPTEIQNEAASTGSGDHDRRDALAKIARFAAYTAPALLVMVTGAKATVISAEE